METREQYLARWARETREQLASFGGFEPDEIERLDLAELLEAERAGARVCWGCVPREILEEGLGL